MSKEIRKHHDPERAEARRNQVLDAAAECFRHKGFHGASMAEISKLAGMSAGHIYNYFASKDEIIFGIVDRNTQDILQRMQDVASGGRDAYDALIERLPITIEENTDLEHVALMLEVSSEAARNASVRERLHAADKVLSARLEELLSSSKKIPAFQADPQRHARVDMLISLFEGIRHRALHNPELDRQALLESMRKVIAAILT
ncbi:TetR/AcrR family transcriptional regulator [Uliginosibacterium sediminicola]|uniref:TetR/AcrR family transcriptional regulator n=1 Tax=Uliginosibacterium sediminicola TaxID=2024550 RepID=A0ABU9Z3Y2_9RHOO